MGDPQPFGWWENKLVAFLLMAQDLWFVPQDLRAGATSDFDFMNIEMMNHKWLHTTDASFLSGNPTAVAPIEKPHLCEVFTIHGNVRSVSNLKFLVIESASILNILRALPAQPPVVKVYNTSTTNGHHWHVI